MNSEYHFNTIKTLAVHAGFDAEAAQYIAYFSQYVDDFIMHSPFITDTEPPEFFVKNRLAQRLTRNRWGFLPCTTGINTLRSVSSGYRLSTLMPFHFITPQEYHEMPDGADRSLYRCMPAKWGSQLQINRLIAPAAKAASAENKTSLMVLGMLLHTFADTYAHTGFSGFQGWENASYVQEGMRQTESAFYRALPSIGHANVGTAPDECGLSIVLYAKRAEKSEFEPLIARDNTDYFADCSRRILDMLCAVNKKPPFNDRQWEALQAKLAEAQKGRGRQETAAWARVFPEISYAYHKDAFVQIRLELLRHDETILQRLRLRPDDLTDVHSEESDRGRLSSLTLARHANDAFYQYNEAAYRHVFHTTGAYTTRSHHTQLETYCHLAGGVT